MVACAETLTAERKGKKLCARCELYLENRGYRYDAETENYYVRNRYYSPSHGRWLTRDPIGYRGGINLYGYVENGPVGNVDGQGTDFIALADHWIILTPLFHHYSIEYWKSCKNPPIGKVEYYGQFKGANPGSDKKSAVELEPTLYHDSFVPVLVSFIVFTDAHHKFESPFAGTPAQVKSKWEAVVAAANAYKFAEHMAPPQTGASFKNWPNSEYQLPPGGDNSNTFAETTVKAAGIPWRGLPGNHPGNNAPLPVHSNVGKSSLTIGPPPPPPLML